jgi:MFS family permease
MIALMRQRNFALLWTGGLISMIGNWMLFTAMPIYVYQLTGSALATSITFIAATIPGLVFSSFAGVFVDRWDRKQVMVISNVLFAATLLPLILVNSPEWVWLVYVVVFVQNCISRFFNPAENALLPRIVAADQLVAANALNALNNNLARLIGPPLGGLVAAGFSLSGVVVIDALTFVLAGAMIALVSVAGKAEPAAESAATAETSSGFWSELRAGLAIIVHSRALLVIFLVTAICSFGEGIMSVMFILWVSKVLEGGAQEIGLFMGAQAIGGILGGLIVTRVGKSLGTTRLLWLSGILFGLIDLLLFNYPRFFSGIWLGLALIALVGVPAVGFFAGQTTLLQEHVEDRFRGRVFGAYGTMGAIFYLLSTVLVGLVGNAVEPMLMLTIQGAAYVLAGLLVLFALTQPALDLSPRDNQSAVEPPA